MAGLLSHLAMTDIAHGEPDVSGEWLILRVTAGLMIGFILLTLITLGKCVRVMSNGRSLPWHD